MALKKFSSTLAEGSPGFKKDQRLDQYLAAWLSCALSQSLSKAKIRKLIIAGAVYLNGKRVRIASKIIFLGARVEVYVDLERLNLGLQAQEMIFQMTEEAVLFEDEYLIVVNKPAHLPTQPTLDEARANLFLEVKKFLARRAGKSISEIYLGLHHRLDRDTSGVVLFTKSQMANPGVADLFSHHQIEKIYQALSTSPLNRSPEKVWEVKNYLGEENRRSGKKSRYASVRAGGKYAHTELCLLFEQGGFYGFQARPFTGRTHQIRVHLSESGFPIFGDLFYGGVSQLGNQVAPRMMLHALQLKWIHPIFKTEILVKSPLPRDFLSLLQKSTVTL